MVTLSFQALPLLKLKSCQAPLFSKIWQEVQSLQQRGVFTIWSMNAKSWKLNESLTYVHFRSCYKKQPERILSAYKQNSLTCWGIKISLHSFVLRYLLQTFPVFFLSRLSNCRMLKFINQSTINHYGDYENYHYSSNIFFRMFHCHFSDLNL